MELPVYNYPTLGLACHWHAICQQLAACSGIVKDLTERADIGKELALEKIKELEKNLEKAKTPFQCKNLQQDIERLHTVEESRKFMLLTLAAVHDDVCFQKYIGYGIPKLRSTIKAFYDIPINSPEMIMLDSAKIYEYLLKYYVQKEMLYVSTDNNVKSTKEAIIKYKPTYILIHANRTFTVKCPDGEEIEYTLISVSKGSGHFYCEHIKFNGEVRQFDDRSPKGSIVRHTVNDVMRGIQRSEIKIAKRNFYLKDDVIEGLRAVSGITEEELSKEDISEDEGINIVLRKVFKEKGFDLDKEINKTEALEKFKDTILSEVIQNLPDSFTYLKVSAYIESNKEKYYSTNIFTTFGYDQMFYGMAMLLKTKPIGSLQF